MGVVVIWSSDPLGGSNIITSLSRDIFKNFSLCLFDSSTWKLWCVLHRANCDSFMDQAFLSTAFRGSFCISLPLDRISLKQTCILFHSGPFYLTVLASSQRRALNIWAQRCFSFESFFHQPVLAVILFLPRLALPAIFFFLCPWRSDQLLQSVFIRVSVVQGTWMKLQ